MYTMTMQMFSDNRQDRVVSVPRLAPTGLAVAVF